MTVADENITLPFFFLLYEPNADNDKHIKHIKFGAVDPVLGAYIHCYDSFLFVFIRHGQQSSHSNSRPVYFFAL